MTKPSLNGIMCVVFLIVATLVVALTAQADNAPTNYELLANCIAEYDYHHPEQPQFDNLVAALREC